MATAEAGRAGARPGYWLPLCLIGALAVVAGLLVPQLLPGEEAAPSTAGKGAPADLSYAPPAWPDPPSPRAMFVRLGVGTAVVLGLCVVTLWGGRRWLGPLAGASPAGGTMRLVETLHLGNRCCLHLVQLPSRQVLVGADGTGIKTIVPVTETFESALADAALPTAE